MTNWIKPGDLQPGDLYVVPATGIIRWRVASDPYVIAGALDQPGCEIAVETVEPGGRRGSRRWLQHAMIPNIERPTSP